MSNLFIVATPIGNLEDITLRALRVLKEVDFVMAEDSRVTSKLLAHYNIQKPIISYFQHSRLERVEKIIEFLMQGKNLALVSDAGTPGISDPGNKLIEEILKRNLSVKIVSVPGPSALTAAASVSGLPTDKFLFLGFPPAKKKRQKFFEGITSSNYTVIFYESTHRILKTLAELKDAVGDREIFLARELTKIYETLYRGRISEIEEKLKGPQIKGEFVILVPKNV